MPYVVKFQFTKPDNEVEATVVKDKDASLSTQLQSAQDAAGITSEYTLSEDFLTAELVLTSPDEATWQTFVTDHLHPALSSNNATFTGMINDNASDGVTINTIIIDEDGNETTNEFGTPAEVVASFSGS